MRASSRTVVSDFRTKRMVNRATLNISNATHRAEHEPRLPAAVPHGFGPLRIGPLVVDPPILQVPMAGFTNYAFRQIVRDYGGVGLQATEMVNAEASYGWMSMKRNIPIDCGAFAMNRGHWPCRSGTTIRRRWPKSADGWWKITR